MIQLILSLILYCRATYWGEVEKEIQFSCNEQNENYCPHGNDNSEWYHTADLTNSIDKFYFSQKCCQDGYKKFTETIGLSSNYVYGKYFFFNEYPSNFKYFFVKMKFPSSRFELSENLRPDGMVITFGCFDGTKDCRTTVDTNFRPSIFISSKSLVLFSDIDQQWWINYQRTNDMTKIPLLYIDGIKSQTVTFVIFSNFINSTVSEHNYVATGKIGIVSLISKVNGKNYFSKVSCERYQIKRIFLDDNSLIPHNDCSCKPFERNIIVSNTLFNLPDCNSNHSIFNLNLKELSNESGEANITIDNGEWYTVEFETNIHYSINSPLFQFQELSLNENCSVVFHGLVNVKTVVVSTSSNYYFRNGLNANSITNNDLNDDSILFRTSWFLPLHILSENDLKICGNRIVHKDSFDGCLCTFDNNYFYEGIVDDSCDFSKVYTNNSLNLLIATEEYNSSISEYWESISIVQQNCTFSDHPIISQKCYFGSKSIILNCNMTCVELYIDGNSSVVIQENTRFVTEKIIISGFVLNLNLNGLIINYGIIEMGSAINYSQVQNEDCFELVSSKNPLTFGGVDSKILLLENKMIRICPNYVNNSVLCDLYPNSLKTKYSAIHCPCESINCEIISYSQMINLDFDFNGKLILNQLESYSVINTKSTLFSLLVNNSTAYYHTSLKETFINYSTGADRNLFFTENKGIAIDGFELTINDDSFCEIISELNHQIKCLKCNNYLLNGNCYEFNANGCLEIERIDNKSYCSLCQQSYYSIGFECRKCSSNCLRCNETECFLCEDGFKLGSNKKCESVTINNLKLFSLNYVVQCVPGYYSSLENCIQPPFNCLSYNHTSNNCLVCNSSEMLVSDDSCAVNPNASIVSNFNSISCNTYFGIIDGECVSCNDFGDGCLSCNKSDCLQCDQNYVLNSNKECVGLGDTLCVSLENDYSGVCLGCTKPELFFNGSGCVAINDSCLAVTYDKTCLECRSGYVLDSFKNICVLKENSAINTMCSEYRGGNGDKCVRCLNGFYFEETINWCLPCNDKCLDCISKNKCLNCDSNYTLVNYTCVASSSIISNCKTLIPLNKGCAICHDHYFRNTLNMCSSCISNCKTCYSDQTCIFCANGYYLKYDSTECIPTHQLKNCSEFDGNGCVVCNVGFFIRNQECISCNSKISYCSECSNEDNCNQCVDSYIMKNTRCIGLSEFKGCVEVSKSRCVKCSFWYELSDNNQECVRHVVWWFILLVTIAFILILIGVVVILSSIIITVANKVMEHQRNEKLRETVAIFSINMSNIKFFETNIKNVLVNSMEIYFYLEESDSKQTDIPVNQETKSLICVANKGKCTIKVQFSTKENCEKYSIRTNPQMIMIPKGKACEFEIFITPLCSSSIKDHVKLFVSNFNKGETKELDIKILAETQLSTKLDPDELKEERKLGEGSFGVVYLGTFRGNKVAIKKMKQIKIINDKLKEFEKEVAMLDKFRSEYIIYFYGAVFIQKKMCLVTEFAQFGSLEDFLTNNDGNASNPMKIIIKLILDAAKGIQYLHTNGILHRDIKPDNILVVSMMENEKVNAKLTDFGSSRNVNMLMTNMTFTKGIGTPVYMAPEVLNQEKYKMQADIYSFEITMYECFGWCECYPKSEFPYPWNIADFVCDGYRRPKPESMTEVCFGLIKKCWCSEPSERIKIGEVIEHLECMLILN